MSDKQRLEMLVSNKITLMMMNFALYLKLIIYTFVYSIVFIMMSRARAETVRRLQLLEMIGTKKTLQSDDGMH